jgi:hypothetical protein
MPIGTSGRVANNFGYGEILFLPTWFDIGGLITAMAMAMAMAGSDLAPASFPG